jgi:flagellar L-ring protein precursor FlgH
MKPVFRLIQMLVLLSLAVGCAQTRIIVQPDPQYAPVDLTAMEFKPESNGSIFQTGRSVRLFEDNKAYRIGDVLSVTLLESTNASKSAETSTEKEDEADIGASLLFGSDGPTVNGNLVLNSAFDAEREFSGKGDSAQSNSLEGEIAVTVVDVLPSGNLVVRGEKIIGLNQGSEFIRISGLVRPQDVSTDNIVVSTKLANSRIFYGGGGTIAESNTKGWLSRFFDSPVFPL